MLMVDGRTGSTGKGIVVRTGVSGGRKSRSRPVLAVIVITRRRELGPVAGLAVTNLRVSLAGATAWTILLTALRTLGTRRQMSLHALFHASRRCSSAQTWTLTSLVPLSCGARWPFRPLCGSSSERHQSRLAQCHQDSALCRQPVPREHCWSTSVGL